jgi:hypothetical protein
MLAGPPVAAGQPCGPDTASCARLYLTPGSLLKGAGEDAEDQLDDAIAACLRAAHKLIGQQGKGCSDEREKRRIGLEHDRRG